MSALKDTLIKLTKQLFPTGRAFKMPIGSNLDIFIKANAETEERVVLDIASIKTSILPDNDQFDEDDAENWERVLGISSSSLVDLEDRKAAIRQKMQQPGDNPAKGSWEYVQEVLRAAGFDVYVFENRFPDYPTGYFVQDPVTVSGSSSILTEVQHDDIQHGDAQHGSSLNNKIVNYISEELDFKFDEGTILKNTFFIGGDPVGSFANVPLVRKDEFRQLILKSKPAQMVGYLFINYV